MDVDFLIFIYLNEFKLRLDAKAGLQEAITVMGKDTPAYNNNNDV